MYAKHYIHEFYELTYHWYKIKEVSVKTRARTNQVGGKIMQKNKILVM